MLDLVISIDSTGSMASAVKQVKQNVSNLIGRLFSDLTDLRIAVVTHGNYCDKPNILTKVPFQSSEALLTPFVAKLQATGGGWQTSYKQSNCTACYELVMQWAKTLDWRDGARKVIVMVGDENPSNPITYPVNWQTELQELAQNRVTIYGVHCLNLSNTRWFYERIARDTDGVMLSLNQFSDITEILLAIGYKEKGSEALDAFEFEIKTKNRMSRNLAQAFAALSGKKVSDIADFSQPKGNLVPVDPQRFQILNVNEKIDIKGFVEKNGATFKKGRGFYEVTKAVEVQPYKEVVLVDRSSGDMWSGSEARNILGLDPNSNCTLQVKDIPKEYQAFIQSTSVNRALLPHTKFMYELDHI